MENTYVKPYLTIEQQIELLKSRGLIINDLGRAKFVLASLNYYRFSAYSLTLRSEDIFYPGITFDNVYELYCFDDEFRGLIFKYTSIIEIAFRTHISHYHAKQYGPLGYLNYTTFFDPPYHGSFLNDLHRELKRSKDIFVQHHKNNHYGIFPFWVAIEVTTFGDLSKLFKNLIPEDKSSIAREFYSVGWAYVENWLRVCVAARNIAAHGGRFYNRIHATSVKVAKNMQNRFSVSSSFAFILAIHKLLPSNALRNEFSAEISSLLAKYPFSDKSRLGFPDDWIELLEDQSTPK